MPRASTPIVQCPKCKKFFYWLKGIERCPCGEPVPPEVAFAPLIENNNPHINKAKAK